MLVASIVLDGGGAWTPFAGTNRIRFQGSVALETPHSQRREGAPLSRVAGIVHPFPGRSDRLGTVPDAAHPATLRVRESAARSGVHIEIVTFDESTHTAAEAARAIGAELGQIVKSLVFVAPDADRGGDGARDGLVGVVALICGTDRVDIGRLAEHVRRPGLRRANAEEAQRVTGFVIGGIPPFGHRERLPVVMDPGLFRFDEVWAAAGTPTAVFRISPDELRRSSGASVAACAEEPTAASTAGA
jgi:prolyl-tRNA editing enzyme YbaK/EbsC (Cys-tRNA(Pro) deacylase)